MRQILLKSCLVLTSVTLALVGLEVVFRLAINPSNKDHTKNDRPQFYIMPEGARYLQDRSYSESKEPNSFRISVVGDSFSFGPYLQYDDTFPKRLERWFNLNTKQPKVEVINRGICGLATKDEVREVEDAVSKGSDLIILQITLNDPELRPLDLKDAELENKYHFGKIDTETGIYSYWKSLGFVVQRIHNESTRNSYRRYFHDLFFEEQSWSVFRDSIQKIAEICSSHKVKLLTVVFPVFSFPLDKSYPFDDIHQRIADLMNQLQIKSLDLRQTFSGLQSERLQVWPGNDPHPGEIAHRIAAEAIYRWLARHEWVPAEIVADRLYKKRADLKFPSLPKSKFLGLDNRSDLK